MDMDFEVNMNEYLPLRDVVFNTLRKAILRGELKPGERLMEIQLANKLGVSRTPIREAIRKLELEGLVLMIPRKGAEVAQITEKKAGIIKDGCRVVTARQKPEAMQVIERISREHGAKCTIADASEAEMLKESCLGQTIRYRGEEYEIPLAGVYQKENAVVALNALKVLDELGFPTAAEQKKEGLRTVNWNGRFTVICKKPLFVVDGAHNPAAADMMAASIEHYFKGKRIIYIMGVFADKDYRSVIQKTAHFADRILTIQTPDNIRALPAGELAKTVSEYNPNVQAMDTIKDAVEEAFSLAGEQDVIIAFGSLSFIGEMTDIVENL